VKSQKEELVEITGVANNYAREDIAMLTMKRFTKLISPSNKKSSNLQVNQLNHPF